MGDNMCCALYSRSCAVSRTEGPSGRELARRILQMYGVANVEMPNAIGRLCRY